jgi:hypothetical protein
VLANTRDPETMQSMTEGVWEGRDVGISTDGDTNLLEG